MEGVSNLEKKLVLIDGNSIAYRAFFALPLLNNDKGVYTNAVYGFTTMLLKVLEEEKPSHILVAFDAGKTTFRHKTYKEYKGGRQKTPPELSEQFAFIHELLDAFNISRYQLDQYEADDIIGTLAHSAADNGINVKVISGDKDLLQLVSDKVSVALTRKGISEVDTYDPKALDEKYGLTAKQIIDLKALMGDPSDNIPGVPGVGEKTALKLLKEFATVEKVLDSIDEVSGKKLKEKLTDNRDQALMSKELVTINQSAPLTITFEETEYDGYDAEKVVRLFKDLSFNSLLGRFEGETDIEEEEIEDIDFNTITEVTEEMLNYPSAVIVEVTDENYHHADIQGIAIVNESGNYFISVEKALSSQAFLDWLKDDSKEKFVFDAKKTKVALKWKDIDINGISFDLFLASYLINPAENHHDIPAVAKRKGVLNVQLDEAIYGKGAKFTIPKESVLAEHLVRKGIALYKLKEIYITELQENNQYDLFVDLEMPLSLVLAEMEYTGVNVDVDRLKKMGNELLTQLHLLESEIHELAGEKFNINSPKQLGIILFEKLGLPVVKKTKTGYSTSADILEKLEDKHEIISKILHYRQLGKLNSTYIEGLLKVVLDPTGKIHTRFNQALTQTGRLSSTEPNLQNIPIRLEEGRKIRQAFIPSEKDWFIFAADYSQIELRVLAHIAEDEGLTEAFNKDMDIHTKTAMDVFGVEDTEVTSNMRRQAKAVNFGIVYGISDYGLSQSLDITRKEAGKFIDRYLETFPGVKTYMEEIVQVAKQNGYVSTLMERRRYLPEITSRNFNQRSFAERTAMNTPIQGSAADIIKIAMINMAKRIKEENLKTRLLLQVHDELIFEAPKEEIEILKKLVPDVMENAMKLNVPLKVDFAYGTTWYDAK